MTGRPEPYADGIARWLGEVGNEQVRSAHPRMSGATTATIVPFDTTSGRRLIAKIYDRNIAGVGADDVERDARAMTAAAEVSLDAPVVLDADPTGTRLGSPAIVMTRLDGEPRAFGGDDPEAWCDGLADALVTIGSAPLPGTVVPSYRSWVPTNFAIPTWTTQPALWDAVSSALAADLPASPARFIHRDFHQLNVLWSKNTPSGTVDWVNGCLGPIESDIASGRVNIAIADQRYDGIALADRFLERCQRAGLPWHPSWDLDFIAGVADRPEMFLVGRDFGADMTLASVSENLEAMAARALDDPSELD